MFLFLIEYSSYLSNIFSKIGNYITYTQKKQSELNILYTDDCIVMYQSDRRMITHQLSVLTANSSYVQK